MQYIDYYGCFPSKQSDLVHSSHRRSLEPSAPHQRNIPGQVGHQHKAHGRLESAINFSVDL